jgi:hypothetical protein
LHSLLEITELPEINRTFPTIRETMVFLMRKIKQVFSDRFLYMTSGCNYAMIKNNFRKLNNTKNKSTNDITQS